MSDALYILVTALEGYQQLYSHAGYFRVEEDQICVERGGRVRVWVNGDFSRNHPSVDSETVCLQRDETHMVRQLVDLLESNTDPEQLPLQSITYAVAKLDPT